jgi:DNA-binding SARP family transcriptional activator
MKNKVTYRQQYTRCGKQRCRKCKEGPGHGPYWYAYYSEHGHTVSKYIGIHAPADLNMSRGNQPAEAPAWPATAAPALESSKGKEWSGRADLYQAAVVEGRDRQSYGTPVENAHGQPLLRIYVLGHFRIEMKKGDEWAPITNRTWQRRRARALLGCLLSTSSRRIGREQAMEALWPDLDIETAANRLNGAVHEVRQVLEPGISRPAASRLLRLERDMLMLADASLIWVDAEAFEKLLNKVNTLSDAALVEQAIEEALLLYNGDYLLEELYSEWAAPRRESLRRSWMGLLLKLAEIRASRGALTGAIEPLERLLTSDATNETAVRRLMELLTQLDRRGEAFRVHQRLVETLRREYENEPLPETTALYRALKQGTYQAPQASAPAPVLRASRQVNEQQRPAPQMATFPRPVLQLGRHNQSRLVGRDEELETIKQFLLAIEELPQEKKGKGKIAHSLLLMGESGIGKTRLAEEVSYEADVRGWSVVWAHGYEQEGTIPYRPWAEIFRTLLKNIQPSLLAHSLEAQARRSSEDDASGAGHAAATAQARLARLSSLVPELGAFEMPLTARERDALSPTPEQERLHLWEAATAVLGILSESAPLLVVLDDLHWTDDSSLALLAYVVRHMQQERIAVIATCRNVELSPGSNLSTLIQDLRREQAIVALPVKPLNELSIGSLVSHLPEHIVKGILLQAGGNPFFAEELARVSEAGLMATGGDGKPQYTPGVGLELDMEREANGGMASTATPESIKAVLDRRLARLSGNCQLLLGKAAVLGGSFSLSQLTFLAGDQGTNEENIFDLLEEALRAGLLTEEGAGARIKYHFWHPLIVSHLYERQSAARRAQLHRKAAQALMQLERGSVEEVAASITNHLIRGGSDAAHVGHYAEMAANRAYALYGYSEAKHYYGLAVEALTSGTSALEIGDPLHLASILERIAECCMVHGDFEETRSLYERVLELRKLYCAREGIGMSAEEAQRQALIWCRIGKAWGENGNLEEAARCYERGQQVMVEAGVTSGAAWASLYLELGNLNWRLGNNETARGYGQEALEMIEHIMQQQEKQVKQAALTTSAELATLTSLAMIGGPFELGRCHQLLGIVAATLGQFKDALEHLNQAIAILEQRDQVAILSLLYGNLAAVYAMKAEYDTARTYFQRTLEMAKRDHNLPGMAWVYGNLGETAQRRGYLIEAEKQLRQSLALAYQVNDPEQASWVHTVLALTLCDLGNMADALWHIRRGLKMGRSVKSVLCMGIALIALGEWRITRAIQVSRVQIMREDAQDVLLATGGDRLLKRATQAVRRALALEGLDREATTEGRLVLASALYLEGEIEEAHQVAMQNLREAEQYELPRVVARTQRLLGRILAAQDRSDAADGYFEQALEMFARHEMRLDYARALHGYGVTLLQRGTQEEGKHAYLRGLRCLREARDIFVECHAPIDVEWVEGILSDPAYEGASLWSPSPGHIQERQS